MDRSHDPDSPIPRLLDYDDVAVILKLSTRSVHRLVASGELRSIRIAGSVRFDPTDIRQFILLQRTAPPAPAAK
jgi:excisionase family DNA binding protein